MQNLFNQFYYIFFEVRCEQCSKALYFLERFFSYLIVLANKLFHSHLPPPRLIRKDYILKNRKGLWKIKQRSDYGFTVNSYQGNEIEPYFHLSPQKTFIDIGAHIGKWSVYAARRQPSARIYACEANSETYQYLCETIHLNSLNGKVFPLWTAISNFNGKAGFIKNPIYTSTSRISRDNPNNTVNVQTLPSLIQCSSIDINSIELIKIDVEGEELNILQGMTPLFPTLPFDCRIICEILNKNENRFEIINLMRRYGYSAKELSSGTDYLFQKQDPIPASVCILTLNEERNIKICLDSVQDFADIVVVDSGSSDRTLEIVSHYPQARIFKHMWEGYPAQRNYASSNANYPMIFVLDADEELSSGLSNEIRNLLRNKELSHNIFTVRLIDYLWWDFAPHSSWGSFQPRLYNRTKTYFEGCVHERLAQKNQSIGKLKNSIFHRGHISVEKTLAKFNKYAELEAEEALRVGTHWNLLWLRIPYISTKFFFGALIAKGFIRDGTLGIVSAFLLAFYKALVLIKYAEQTKRPE